MGHSVTVSEPGPKRPRFLAGLGGLYLQAVLSPIEGSPSVFDGVSAQLGASEQRMFAAGLRRTSPSPDARLAEFFAKSRRFAALLENSPKFARAGSRNSPLLFLYGVL